MNRIHGMYRIQNEDFLYTLSTFVFVPIDWIDRFGWRKLYPNERLGLFHFWREVGTRMNIENMPETFEAFQAFSLDYERRTFARTESAQRVANATRDLLLSFYLPKPLWKPGEPFVYAVMDESLLRAIGYPIPSLPWRGIVEGLMRARARVLRVLPKNKYPKMATLLQYATHPDGYTVDDIGPDSVRRRLAKGRPRGRPSRNESHTDNPAERRDRPPIRSRTTLGPMRLPVLFLGLAGALCSSSSPLLPGHSGGAHASGAPV